MTNLTELGKKGVNGIAFDPRDLVRELIAYGEPEAARMMGNLSDQQHLAISALALKILLRESCTIDKAICLAAVENNDGMPRPLRRKRRVYPKT